MVWAAHPELIKDVLFENINQQMINQSKWPHRIDLRPNGNNDVIRRKHNAFDVMNATDVVIRNSRVTWDSQTRSMYGELLSTENSPGLIIESLTER